MDFRLLPRAPAVYDRLMGRLVTCAGCGGFLDATAALCPHCGVQPTPARRRRWAVLFGLAGSASLGLTMMACYGGPPCEGASGKCTDLPDATSDTSRSDAGAD